MAGAMNPLEKKARMSFLKGLLIAALIGILVIVLLGYKIYKMSEEEKARLASLKPVVVLNTSVASGDEITPEMLVSTKANTEVATTGAITMGDYTNLRDVFDENDNLVKTNKIIAKIDIPAKTILTQDMIVDEENKVTNDIRELEYNMIVLPTTLVEGETVDIRLKLPSGVDYLVLSKKRVTIPILGEGASSTTILMNVKEEEILLMDSAIVDAYRITGSKLYAVKYTDPGLQAAAITNYMPTAETADLIQKDSNIVNEARIALINRYNQEYGAFRPGIENALNGVEQDERESNLEAGISSEISKQESERQQYIQSIYGAE